MQVTSSLQVRSYWSSLFTGVPLFLTLNLFRDLDLETTYLLPLDLCRFDLRRLTFGVRSLIPPVVPLFLFRVWFCSVGRSVWMIQIYHYGCEWLKFRLSVSWAACYLSSCTLDPIQRANNCAYPLTRSPWLVLKSLLSKRHAPRPEPHENQQPEMRPTQILKSKSKHLSWCDLMGSDRVGMSKFYYLNEL